MLMVMPTSHFQTTNVVGGSTTEGGIQRVRRRFGLPLELACKPVGLCNPKDRIFLQSFRMTAKFVGDWDAWFFPQQAAKSLIVGPGDFL
ncbi:MAG TPA: hypothetical protein VFC44_17270 [Candidatus Saccharimonadales bacterium]|nr:hypothetical protein [Candidatus Saccharimonadales bacterium]